MRPDSGDVVLKPVFLVVYKPLPKDFVDLLTGMPATEAIAHLVLLGGAAPEDLAIIFKGEA
jgi:hypothetical protein